MKRFKDLVKEPSEALQAMIRGLEAAEKMENFQIDMLLYLGTYENGMCFGCAATCAIMDITKVPLNKTELAYDWDNVNKVVDIEYTDYHHFEQVMDHARRGSMSDLFRYFGILPDVLPKEILNPPFYLHNDDWKEQIEKVNTYIGEIQELGY